jgi:hypothetical protein
MRREKRFSWKKNEGGVSKQSRAKLKRTEGSAGRRNRQGSRESVIEKGERRDRGKERGGIHQALSLLRRGESEGRSEGEAAKRRDLNRFEVGKTWRPYSAGHPIQIMSSHRLALGSFSDDNTCPSFPLIGYPDLPLVPHTTPSIQGSISLGAAALLFCFPHIRFPLSPSAGSLLLFLMATLAVLRPNKRAMSDTLALLPVSRM